MSRPFDSAISGPAGVSSSRRAWPFCASRLLAAPARPLGMRHLSASRCAGPERRNGTDRLSSPRVQPFLARHERRTMAVPRLAAGLTGEASATYWTPNRLEADVGLTEQTRV